MANKETVELGVFIAAIINGVVDASSDGFNFTEDLPKLIGPALKAQPGIEGIDRIDDEGATMTNTEKDEIAIAISGELTKLNENDRRDTTDLLTGLHGLARIFWRRGYEAGLQAINA